MEYHIGKFSYHRRSGRVSLLIDYDKLKMHINLKATNNKKKVIANKITKETKQNNINYSIPKTSGVKGNGKDMEQIEKI